MSAKWILVDIDGVIQAAAIVVDGDDQHAVEFVSEGITATDRIIRTDADIVLGSKYEGDR